MLMSQQNAVRVQTAIPIVALIAACVMGGKIITAIDFIKEALRDNIAEQRILNTSIERRLAEVERRLDRYGVLSGMGKQLDGNYVK